MTTTSWQAKTQDQNDGKWILRWRLLSFGYADGKGDENFQEDAN